LFHIPLELYSPSLHGVPTISYRFSLAGNRLARIGKRGDYHLRPGHAYLTVVNHKAHTYSVETLDEARQRLRAMLKRWSSFPITAGTYETVVQETGRKRQMGDQTAAEFRIIAIGPSPGRRRVAASSIYWMVAKARSEELAAFQLKWSRESGLPTPGLPPARDDSAFGAMARAASKLPGYAINYVVVDRPVPGAQRTARQEVDVTPGRIPASPGAFDQMEAGMLLQIHVTETAFSDLIAGAAVDRMCCKC
jgi:hypothetical protein